MSEPNKRHNRKIWRSCPVCKSRVVIAHRNDNWWVTCDEDSTHIPQRFFPYAHEAIEVWNVKANKQTNADRIRAMSDEELVTVFLNGCGLRNCRSPKGTVYTDCHSCALDWLKEEASE